MIVVRKAAERGVANFGWLQSKHSFSFGHYYEPKHMGFSALRVINDDHVAPSAGFETHGHRDMEIISYVLKGEIAHKDSEGNVQVLPAGEFQLMSAGRGIFHSEFNNSAHDALAFLQIWVEPNIKGTAPGYQQKNFGTTEGITTIVTPDGEGSTLQIKQDAKLHQLILTAGKGLDFDRSIGEHVYIHVIQGELLVNESLLQAGDGAKVSQSKSMQLKNTGKTQVTALIFELP